MQVDLRLVAKWLGVLALVFGLSQLAAPPPAAALEELGPRPPVVVQTDDWAGSDTIAPPAGFPDARAWPHGMVIAPPGTHDPLNLYGLPSWLMSALRWALL